MFKLLNLPQQGLMGRCAATLSDHQWVFPTLNDRGYMRARFVGQMARYGLQLGEPLFWPAGGELKPSTACPDALRIPVEMPATLVTTAPVLSGRVRCSSDGGMMIETGIAIPE